MMEDQDPQSRFAAIYQQYLGRFKEDPPVASMGVDEAIAAMEQALARGMPLTDDRAAAPHRRD